MFPRTLKGGLLATAMVLALLPTATGATAASATAQHPAPSAVAQSDTHHRVHHHRHHLRRQHAHRVHRGHRYTSQGAVYRSVQRATAYRIASHMTPYRLHHHLSAQPVSHRRVLPVAGRVTTRHAWLNVRSGPGTGYRVIGHRQSGRQVGLVCETRGSWVHGNRIWYRLRHHAGYVSAHYVRASRTLPWC